MHLSPLLLLARLRFVPFCIQGAKLGEQMLEVPMISVAQQRPEVELLEDRRPGILTTFRRCCEGCVGGRHCYVGRHLLAMAPSLLWRVKPAGHCICLLPAA